MAARRRLIPRARPSDNSSVNPGVEVLLFPPAWVIGVVSPVAVAWKMEVAGIVEFEAVAGAVEVAVEVGRRKEIERREEVNTERADTEVVDWEEIEGSELFSVDDELIDDAEAVEVEVKVEVGMISAVRLARTADRGSKSPVTVVAAAEEAAGGLKKFAGSAVVRYANVRSVVSKHITILQISQHLMREEKEDL